jgi:hypothetical protein
MLRVVTMVVVVVVIPATPRRVNSHFLWLLGLHTGAPPSCNRNPEDVVRDSIG